MLTPSLDDVSACKRGRPRNVAVCLNDCYPELTQSVHSTEEEKTACEGLRKEMLNAKPRKDIFLPLMKITFSLRRHYILHDALSVCDILQDYPALKLTDAVS